MMDLDVVIVGDLTRLLGRPEDFVINTGVMPYNGSLMLFDADCAAHALPCASSGRRRTQD